MVTVLVPEATVLTLALVRGSERYLLASLAVVVEVTAGLAVPAIIGPFLLLLAAESVSFVAAVVAVSPR